MVAWGPGMEDWQVRDRNNVYEAIAQLMMQADERARKHLKLLLPAARRSRSRSPPTLPHLRSSSPPVVSPYPAPATHHLSYSSFVMEKAVTHSFRSSLLDELEQVTNNLIEGEATLRRALGRLWQVMGENADETKDEASLFVPKREEDDEGDERERRLARAPDLTPPTHKMFIVSSTDEGSSSYDPSQIASPEMQMENLEKSLATLRELQDDGREYVERLQEIREGLGDVRAQRNTIWDVVRERAVKELQEEVLAAVSGA
jgi:hypothetical protein